MSRGTIEIVAHTLLVSAWGKLTSTRLRLTSPDGRTSDMLREVYDHGHAAAVLPYCATTGQVMLVRQFRYPVHMCGDAAWLLETPAGLLDADAPEAAARREAEEETGLRLMHLAPAFSVYTSPGSLTEKLHCFIAAYEEADRIGPGGGLADEGESVEVVEMDFAEALAGCADGRIIDAKTVLLIQHLALSGRMGQSQR